MYLIVTYMTCWSISHQSQKSNLIHLDYNKKGGHPCVHLKNFLFCFAKNFIIKLRIKVTH